MAQNTCSSSPLSELPASSSGELLSSSSSSSSSSAMKSSILESSFSWRNLSLADSYGALMKLLALPLNDGSPSERLKFKTVIWVVLIWDKYHCMIGTELITVGLNSEGNQLSYFRVLVGYILWSTALRVFCRQGAMKAFNNRLWSCSMMGVGTMQTIMEYFFS